MPDPSTFPDGAAPPVLPEADPTAPERVMFKPEIQFREDLKDGLDTLRDLGATEQQLTEHTQTLAEAFADGELASPVARELHQHITAAMKAPPSDDELKAWGIESRKLLRERYGDEADARLARVRAYVQGHKELARSLSYGAGSNPRVVLALAEQAYNLRVPRKKK